MDNLIKNVINNGSTEMESSCTFPDNSGIDENGIENNSTETEEISSSEEVNNRKSISAAELMSRQIEEVPCLVEPILPKTGLACIAGSSDTGKSSLLRYLCMCVVSGKTDFIGFQIQAEHKRAIYVSTEDDETIIAHLLSKQNRDLQEELTNFEGLHYVFNTEELVGTLDGILTEQRADLVCIDAFTDIYRGDMNMSNQVRVFLNDYSQLGQKHQCLILFLHHCGKSTDDKKPSKHNLLGSQAFEAKMRLVMELRNDRTDNTVKHLCIVKGNYLHADHKNDSYRLQFTDNMTFVSTGERTPFENLAKNVSNRMPDFSMPDSEQAGEEDERLKALFEVILSDSAISYSDFCNRIMEQCNFSQATAKRRIKQALDANIIIKRMDGKYYYPDAFIVDAIVVEDDEPLAEELAEEPPPAEERPEWGVGECPF